MQDSLGHEIAALKKALQAKEEEAEYHRKSAGLKQGAFDEELKKREEQIEYRNQLKVAAIEQQMQLLSEKLA